MKTPLTPEELAELGRLQADRPFKFRRPDAGGGEYILTAGEIEWVNGFLDKGQRLIDAAAQLAEVEGKLRELTIYARLMKENAAKESGRPADVLNYAADGMRDLLGAKP